jgi:hypothetical protein
MGAEVIGVLLAGGRLKHVVGQPAILNVLLQRLPGARWVADASLS